MILKTREIKYISLLLITILVISGCTTEKNTFVTRSYHNITAKYNVYYNGNEAFQKGITRLRDNYEEDYSRLLPIFYYYNNESVQSIFSDMDKAMKKASKTIKYHSIKVPPKPPKGQMTKKQKEFASKNEYCNWVDDSYLLMGKALFYKHDFFPAKQNFEFVKRQFNDNPIKYDADMWLARILIIQKQYKKAGEILEIMNDKDFPKKKKGEYSAIYADLYLQQDKIEEAIPKLRSAIEFTKDKTEQTRYKYLLAQIYHRLKDYNKAAIMYQEVLKENPPYIMAFNAQINLAAAYDVAGGDTEALEKQLNKMLHDDKNIEYKDQILYALGKIEEKRGNKNEAVNLYQQSVLKSAGNDNQKGLSYLACAQIFDAIPDYMNAQAYYDSTIMFLNKEHHNYEEISNRAANLGELVKYINTIEHQDSVQMVAQMSEKERNKLIDKIIEDIIEEEKRQKELEQQQNNMPYLQNSRMVQRNQPGGGKWYFYNPTTISYGMSEFKKRWGNRKLEDNWRRKNKAIVQTSEFAEVDSAGADSAGGKALTNKDKEYYLRDLPLTDSLMAVSNTMIEDALFHLAKTYKEKMQNYPKSAETYKRLLEKYPDTDYKMLTYYRLYKLYKDDIKDASKESYYKNKIINEFPDSKYAKLLNNPDYLKELQQQENLAIEHYANTYNAYKQGNNSLVISQYNEALTKYPDSKLIPKYELLKTMAVGKTQSKEAFLEELQKLKEKYAGTEIGERATDLITYLKHGSTSPDVEDAKDLFAEIEKEQQEREENNQEDEEKKEDKFVYNEESTHFYILLVDGGQTDINRTKFNISNFNIDFFAMADFKVSAILFEGELFMITVKKFPNSEEAMRYYKLISVNEDVFKTLGESDYRDFVISADNFSLFYKDKDVAKYLLFFKNNYLNNDPTKQ